MRILRLLVTFILLSVTPLLAQTASPSSQSKSKEQPQAAKPDTHLSPAEADELFKSMDDIMKWVSDDTGLPIHSQIKRELDDRDQVVQYIQEKMEEDEDTKRFERTELVLKKFGMLPVAFQLKPFLLKLLREQVAGFYDSKTKSMHLLDWLSAEAQRPVMAHELTHALQDQTVDLETWTGLLTDASKKAADPINHEIENDEDSTARSALVEGQGTAVMVDYMLLPTGRSVESSPDVVDAMKNAMSSTEGMPTLAAAPILLQETLTFPYREGLGFVQALLKAGGKKLAYTDALKDPPHDTHQILHPEDYLTHQATPVMHMPDLKSVLGKSYEKYDVGSIGEFDVNMLLRQFMDAKSASALSPKWNGGMYYAAFRKQKNVKEASTVNDLALLYVSHWISHGSAQAFAADYGQTVSKRYPGAVRKDCGGGFGGFDCSAWYMNGEPVSVQTIGNTVIVLESFDRQTANALRQLVIANDASPDMKKGNEIHAGNLSMRMAAPYFAVQRVIFH